MSGSPDTPAWIEPAEAAWGRARSCLRRRTPLIYGACFHAHQTAELYLHAALLTRAAPVPRSHDLLWLKTRCVATGVTLDVADADLDALSGHAIEVRYRGAPAIRRRRRRRRVGGHAVDVRYPDALVSLANAREAVVIASRVRRAARRALGLAG
jgi:HEPN domain-containing protein